MSAKLDYKIIRRHGPAIVKLIGVINEDLNLSELSSAIRGIIILDLADIEGITATGLRSWISWINDMEQQGGRFTFSDCSPVVVSKLNLSRRLIGNGIVESFYAPYYCRLCKKARLLKIITAEIANKIPVKKAPICRCDDCDKMMDFDELEDNFFRFLEHSSLIPAAHTVPRGEEQPIRAPLGHIHSDKVVRPTDTGAVAIISGSPIERHISLEYWKTRTPQEKEAVTKYSTALSETKPEIHIGKSNACAINLFNSKFASRQHATIFLRNRHCVIRDNDSANGTTIKRSTTSFRLTGNSMRLLSGDVLIIAEYIFTVMILRATEENETFYTPSMPVEKLQEITRQLTSFELLAGKTPSSKQVRDMIDQVFLTDSDLDAFLIDCYPDVKKRCSAGMERKSKTNLLFELIERLDILTSIREYTGVVG